MESPHSSYPKAKPKKITLFLTAPFIAIQMIAGALALGIIWLVDKDWYNYSIEEAKIQNSPTTAREKRE